LVPRCPSRCLWEGFWDTLATLDSPSGYFNRCLSSLSSYETYSSTVPSGLGLLLNPSGLHRGPAGDSQPQLCERDGHATEPTLLRQRVAHQLRRTLAKATAFDAAGISPQTDWPLHGSDSGMTRKRCFRATRTIASSSSLPANARRCPFEEI